MNIGPPLRPSRLGYGDVDYPFLDSILHQSGGIANPDLLGEIGPVELDRPHTYVELLRNLLVGVSVHDKLEDLRLTRGEFDGGFLSPLPSRGPDVRLDHQL